MTISGKVMLCRNEVICQGKGANSKYSIPIGIVESAPDVLDTSTSRPTRIRLNARDRDDCVAKFASFRIAQTEDQQSELHPHKSCQAKQICRKLAREAGRCNLLHADDKAPAMATLIM